MAQYFNALAAALQATKAPKLVWQFQSNEDWWPFADLNTGFRGWNDPYGVYVIARQSGAVRIGQGQIMRRLCEHQSDRRVTASSLGILSVTWAPVGSFHIDGVERYLANELSPLIGDAFPNVEPIEVNLPSPFLSGRERLAQAIMRQTSFRR
jgi:hypothetical protein